MLSEPNLTRRMFDRVDAATASGRAGQAGGAGARTTLQAFIAAEQAWEKLRNMQVCWLCSTWPGKQLSTLAPGMVGIGLEEFEEVQFGDLTFSVFHMHKARSTDNCL